MFDALTNDSVLTGALRWAELFALVVACSYLIVTGLGAIWFIYLTTCQPEAWQKIVHGCRKQPVAAAPQEEVQLIAVNE